MKLCHLKNKKIYFYIICKERLQSILKKKGLNTEFSTYIYFIDKMENKLLYLENDYKFICLKVKKIQN